MVFVFPLLYCCFHVTIYRWIRRFTPFFKAVSNPLLQTANLQSNEWHADETFMKIRGVTHYLWILLDSEKRVVIAFYLSALRDSSAPLQLFQEAHCLTDAQPAAIITDGLWAYAMPIKMATLIQNTMPIPLLLNYEITISWKPSTKPLKLDI